MLSSRLLRGGCRVCDKEHPGPGGCQSMCCGRGFTTFRTEVQFRCDCKYYWCCYVKCKTCRKEIEINRCRWKLSHIFALLSSRRGLDYAQFLFIVQLRRILLLVITFKFLDSDTFIMNCSFKVCFRHFTAVNLLCKNLKKTFALKTFFIMQTSCNTPGIPDSFITVPKQWPFAMILFVLFCDDDNACESSLPH
jgi:wnt family